MNAVLIANYNEELVELKSLSVSAMGHAVIRKSPNLEILRLLLLTPSGLLPEIICMGVNNF